MKKILLIIATLFLAFHLEAQWVKSTDLEGGIIDCIAASGTNLYAGVEEQGVYLSTNNGTSWTPINNGFGYH